MQLKNCRNMGDIMKFLLIKGDRQKYELVEVEQIHNYLIATYAVPVDRNIQIGNKEKGGYTLLSSHRVNEKKQTEELRIKLDLCKYLEPWKSKADYYRAKWRKGLEAVKGETE